MHGNKWLADLHMEYALKKETRISSVSIGLNSRENCMGRKIKHGRLLIFAIGTDERT